MRVLSIDVYEVASLAVYPNIGTAIYEDQIKGARKPVLLLSVRPDWRDTYESWLLKSTG
jgi:hypothetical protein